MAVTYSISGMHIVQCSAKSNHRWQRITGCDNISWKYSEAEYFRKTMNTLPFPPTYEYKYLVSNMEYLRYVKINVFLIGSAIYKVISDINI